MTARTRAQRLAAIRDAERELHTLAMRSFDPVQVPSELTIRQFQVLVLLRAEPGTTGAALAETMRISTPTVSGLVDRLVAGGWVCRAQDQVDRRRVLLRLTEQAEEMLADLEEPARQAKEVVLTRLRDDELADLERLLGRLREVARDMFEG